MEERLELHGDELMKRGFDSVEATKGKGARERGNATTTTSKIVYDMKDV
jgi:hypothetical protein